MGIVALNNDGTFSLRQWTYSGGRTQSATATGTYTVGTDCTLALTFSSGTPGGGSTGGASFQAPTTFRGILHNTATSGRGADAARGSLILQPVNVSTVVGRFVSN